MLRPTSAPSPDAGVTAGPRRLRALGVVALAVAGTSLGVTGATATGTGSSAQEQAVEAAVEQEDAAPPVTLAFAGDVHAEKGSGAALRAGLPSIRDVLADADLTVVNLEAAITDGGSRADKQFAFRAPESTLTTLLEAGVDAVSLANNHGMDYGEQGLRDTLAAAARTGMPTLGIGLDEDAAYAPLITDVQGQRIAVIGATQVLDGSLLEAWTAGPGKPGLASAKREDRLVEEVERVRADADTVVVLLHWGKELEPCPLPRQEELARRLAGAGADVIVGSHAHVLLGGGYLGGAYVDYGLGNFVFGARSEQGARTGVLKVTVDGREVTDAQWQPARIVDGAPYPLSGAQAEAAIADKERRRDCTSLTAGPQPQR